jgi:FixJ family two-component response regulator
MKSGEMVYLVDDDAAVRDALGTFLRHAGYSVRAYESGEAFLAEFSADCSGCVLLDLSMPGLDGLDVQQRMLQTASRIPIIFLTAYGTVRDTVSAIKAGAFDFLEKPCAEDNLLESIREAILHSHAERAAECIASEAKSNYQSLSPREKEIMALIAHGKSSKQIGRLLDISPRTVDAHRARLMMKMKASSLAELGAMSARFEESAS